MSSRIKFYIVTSSTCLTILLLVGTMLGQTPSSSAGDTLKHLGVFSEVVAHIQREYVEEPDMKSVTSGALDGMLEAIDPFASYLNADQYRDYLKNKDIKRADVGLVLAKRGSAVTVIGVAPDSPAAKAGFTTFDMIESIKGVSTRDMPLAYAEMLLQGEPGSEVELSVVRYRHLEPQTVKLTRGLTASVPVESRMLADQVGYIDVNALSTVHVKEVADAARNLQKQGAKKLVLDMRNCAVGTPEDGMALANLFLKSGRIASLKGQRVPEKTFDADPSKAVIDLPMVVLTNRGTADGAEVAAAALRDNKRAKLVGERTYGDAGMLKALTMDDGSAVILSVAKYYMANGKAIEESGVAPETIVADAEPQIEYDENGEPIPTAQPAQPQQKKLEDDPVVKKALEVLS